MGGRLILRTEQGRLTNRGCSSLRFREHPGNTRVLLPTPKKEVCSTYPFIELGDEHARFGQLHAFIPGFGVEGSGDKDKTAFHSGKHQFMSEQGAVQHFATFSPALFLQT